MVEIDSVVVRFAELNDVEPSRAVTPAGAPETDNEMVCEEPESVEVVSVDEVLEPGLTAPAVDDSVIPKSLTTGALTVSV